MMKTILWGTLLFAELALGGLFLTLMAAGGRVSVGGLAVWTLGLMGAVSAAMAFSLPPHWTRRLAWHGMLVGGAFLFLLPILWLLCTSFKYPEETFVYPPQWLPEIPDAVRHSPYLLSTKPQAIPAADAQAIWTAARPMLPAQELASVDAQAAQTMVTRWLYNALTTAGLAPTDGTLRRPLATDLVNEAWAELFRGVELGHMSALDVDYRSITIPTRAIRWDFRNAAGVPLKQDDAILVNYDFDRYDEFEATATIERAGLPKYLRSLSLPMRQDRSWHSVSVEVRYNGIVYRTTDPLYLGARGGVEWSFKFADVDDRDERSVGTWLLHRTSASVLDPPANGPLQLVVKVRRNPQWRAALAKYTAAYLGAWQADPNWPGYMLNSVTLVLLSVLGQLLSCSMAGFAFARLRWPGRDALFVVLLATMMLPAQVTMIPAFLIFKKLGWYNTLVPLWLPSFFGSAFFIFMLRQFMKAIPRELEEAALIDGCSWFGIYSRVLLPLMRPALAAVAIFTFMSVWNDFMGPLIYLSDQRRYPLSLGLYDFLSGHGDEFGMLTAASMMLILPVIAVFFAAQRYFIEGVTLTGLKA